MVNARSFSADMDAGRSFLAERARAPWHTVAAVVVTEKGRRHLALNLDSRLGRAAVCAEPVAIGMAIAADPDDRIAFVGALHRSGDVLAPCGVCRELMADHAREAAIAVPDPAGYRLATLAELYPAPYRMEDRKP